MSKFSAMSLTIVIALTTSVMAQSADQRAGASAREQMQARYNISVMEGVLERAVEHGAQSLSRQVRAVMPDMLLLSGAAQARGFRLEGYGVFFDVEVPALRRSVAWTLRTMIDENGMAASTALQQLKAFIESSAPEPRLKGNLLQAVKRLELQVGPVQPPAAERATMASAPTVTALNEPPQPQQPAPAPQPTIDRKLLDDPGEAYTTEVKTALIDAMLQYSGSIGVGADEWLTVAARDNEQHDRFTPGDPGDVMTLVLRVKGSDLADFRAERITKEEARTKVLVREF